MFSPFMGGYMPWMGDPGWQDWLQKQISGNPWASKLDQWVRQNQGLVKGGLTLGAGALAGAAGMGMAQRMIPGGGMPMMAGMRGPRPTKAGGMTYRRRPRMQVTNTRALRRALRRTSGFAKIARQVLRTSKTFKSKPRFARRKRRAA